MVALLLAPGLTLAHHAAADAINARIDARLPANRISGNPVSSQLDLRAEDEREKDQALQAAAKKSEPETPAAQRARAASDTMRAKKTRNVVAGE